MLGGIFEKNNIKDKIQTFDKKITESNFWKDKFSAKKILKEKKFFEDISNNFNSAENELENLYCEIQIGMTGLFAHLLGYHFGFPVMNKVLGDLLTSNVSKRISLKDEDMAEILKKDQGKVKVARCPKTPWKDIAIVFLKENEFHVKYDGNTDIINPDRKNKLLNRSGEFSEEYTTLIKFAVNKGIIKAENAKVTVSKKNVSRLREWLKEYTGREDDPIKWYKVQGYVCQFNVQFPSWNRKEVKQRDQDDFDDWQDDNDKWKYIKEH